MQTAVDGHMFLQAVAPDFPLAVIAWGENNLIMSWNRTAEKLFGYTAEQAISHDLAKLLACDAAKNTDSLLTKIMSGQANQVSCRSPSGQTIMTRWKLLQPAKSVQPTTPVIAIVDDIHEQVQLDYDRKLAIRSFDELTEHLNDYISVHDLAGNFTSVNRSIATAFGYTKTEFLKLNIKDIVLPAYHAVIDENIQQKIPQGADNSYYEIQVIKKR